MFAMTDVVVSFWFLPMILFIIIPLLMLFSWTIFRLIKHLTCKLNFAKKKAGFKEAVIRSEGSL